MEMTTTFFCLRNTCSGVTHQTCLTRQQARALPHRTLKYSLCQGCEQGMKIKAKYPEWERKLKNYEVKNRVPLRTFAQAKKKRSVKNTNPYYSRYDPEKARKLSKTEEGILTRLESIGEAEIIAEGL